MAELSPVPAGESLGAPFESSVESSAEASLEPLALGAPVGACPLGVLPFAEPSLI